MVSRIENQSAVTSGQVAGARGPAGKFQAVLAEKLAQPAGLRLSAHAERRLRERNINLTTDDLVRLGRAMEAAAAKGTRDVLLLYGDLSLIASTTNRTVVTAVTREEGQVFTNIDGAVIVK
ncbi:flagellar operon protein [Thermodesulfitimonas autotrophica]|uniref:Flagellar operon protein n=1 Tax=Thermodesulfitimonas autotrophica TaxID=1894989 RepID=A0A3N5AEC5_9THEO|nr:TIGR02530 family flagellar biosynthesis protein [Thermodesulfitimonas autotrophica]RPF42923.1 flagellar operon protein [Thermodesulfitimonas autotrophica]